MTLVFRGFDSWVFNPDTGYFDLEDNEAESCGFVVLVFLGMTKAFVCLSKERSLQSADMSGKSKFLLFSRRMLMSIACCWAAVKLVGAMILFDSGQTTCDSFKSSGLEGEELDGVDNDLRSNVELLEFFVGVFEAVEDREDLRVTGFAGPKI